MTDLTGALIHSARSIPELCMDFAFLVAESRSKDPRTKVGACVYDTVTGSFHLGYNGFPKGIADTAERWQDRETKHKFVGHGEIAALVKALQAGANMDRSILYITHHHCHRCMGEIIRCGIKEVRYAQLYPEDPLADEMAKEAGVRSYLMPRTPTLAQELLARAAPYVAAEADMIDSMQRHFAEGLPGLDPVRNHAEEVEHDIDSYLRKNGLPGILPEKGTAGA